MIFNKNRVSCIYKISGTTTFRLSSSMIFETWGTNLQNWKKKLRQLIKANPGYKLCQADQKGAESLIVAYLAPDGPYRELFKYKIKVHSFVVLHTFTDILLKKFKSPSVIKEALKTKISDLVKIPEWKELASFIQSTDNWPAHERLYFLGKKIVHASSYMMQANKFSLSVLEESEGTIVIERKEAQKYLDNFHSMFPQIRQWHFRLQSEVRKNKVIYNLFGFPYIITNFINENDWADLVAWKPQSTVGTLTNIAVTKLQDYIEENKLDWNILANGHDSYLCEYPDSKSEENHCISKMKEFLAHTFTSPVDNSKFTMESEVQVGKNWGPYHETENPQGLHEIE